MLCTAVQLNAQQWTIYDSSNSNLGNNFVNCLLFHNDTLWAGTENGLYSFQNNLWTDYPNQPFYDVRSLTIEPNGKVWVGSFLNGLANFDGTTWSYFTTANSGLQDNFIRALAFDTVSTSLWVGTSGGLHSYQNTNWTYYNTNNSMLPGNNIPCLAIEQGTLWGGTVNNGLFELTNNVFTQYSLANSGIGDNTILDIAIDNTGNKWLATPANGLSVLSNVATWSIFHIFNSGLSSNSLSSVGFACNNSYLGTSTIGLSTFGSWVDFTTSNSGLPDNDIKAMSYDMDSLLFIGTLGGGVAVFNPCFTTNLEDPIETITFSLYPNPTTRYLNLYFNKSPNNDCLLSIYDVSGRLVHKTKIQKREQSIDLNQLTAGQYFLHFEIEALQFTQKLIKLKD